MINVGQERYPHLLWLCSNAENLPLEDNSITSDFYFIGSHLSDRQDVMIKFGQLAKKNSWKPFYGNYFLILLFLGVGLWNSGAF